MIRINLLKQTTRKKVKRLAIPPKMLVVGGSVLGGIVLIAGVWWAITFFNLFPSGKKDVPAVKDDYTPSSLVGSQMLEDVVDDRDDTRDKLKRRGILDVPYEQLSFVEKVNYEIQYAKNIFDLLSRTSLPGVDFSKVNVASFTQFLGVGQSNSREDVKQFFERLKQEKIDLLPKPQTIIRRSSDGYTFTISCTSRFGLDLEAPFLLGPEDILSYDDLPAVVKRVVTVAKEGNIRIHSGPSQEEAFFIGDYRRFRYRLIGAAAYKNFVSFINELYTRQVPCAFEKIQLVAVTNTSVKIEADLIFTTTR